MSTNLFRAIGDITRTAYGIGQPKPATRPVAGLKQHEHDIESLGWCLHCGYTVEHERGERPVVQIVQLELNTGQHVYPLALRDIPGGELSMIEELIADDEEAAAQAAAESLARDPRDDGDYAFDRANEKRHERVITGTGNASERRELNALCRGLKVQP